MMLKIVLMLIVLAAAAFAESVRETETWIPPKVAKSNGDLDSSGDFTFPGEYGTTHDDDDDDDDEDEANYKDTDYDMSGSGDDSSYDDIDLHSEPKEFDNHIPDTEPEVRPRPTDNEIQLVNRNEVAHPPSIHLSHAGEQNIFKKTEVLAAVIAGGAVGLLFAVLLILLLIYRMKKKDEGSYDLGKKPIYKKAPTTEIYA